MGKGCNAGWVVKEGDLSAGGGGLRRCRETQVEVGDTTFASDFRTFSYGTLSIDLLLLDLFCLDVAMVELRVAGEVKTLQNRYHPYPVDFRYTAS
jgi:hypothetical protein